MRSPLHASRLRWWYYEQGKKWKYDVRLDRVRKSSGGLGRCVALSGMVSSRLFALEENDGEEDIDMVGTVKEGSMTQMGWKEGAARVAGIRAGQCIGF